LGKNRPPGSDTPKYRAGHNSDPQHLRGKKPSMKRVTAISPYSEAVDAAEHCFFAEGGIETIAGAHLDIRASRYY
jgi:hypothetical protein